jgi:hypothetical protein
MIGCDASPDIGGSVNDTGEPMGIDTGGSTKGLDSVGIVDKLSAGSNDDMKIGEVMSGDELSVGIGDVMKGREVMSGMKNPVFFFVGTNVGCSECISMTPIANTSLTIV